MTIYADPQARPRRRPDADRPPLRPRRRDPVWAKVCLILGAIVMVASGLGVAVPKLLAAWATGDIPQANLIPPGLQGKNIDGPINMLLLGMDERSANSADLIRADTIIIVHIPATHDAAYLISLPRDAAVHVPDFAPTNFRGFLTKINAAFAYGARTPQGKVDNSTQGREQGAALTMLTINDLIPGGLTFNGAAIINFYGFKDVLKALGGVDLCVDIETRSIHYDNKGVYHTLEVPYNQRKIYKVGCQHLDYVSALDYARQRHFDQGDYVRQRHQQQLLMAIFKKMTSTGMITDPSKIGALQKAAGQLLTLDLGKVDVIDWMFTLRNITAKKIVMIRTNKGLPTPGPKLGSESTETFTPDSMQLLKAIHDDTVLDFLGTHPGWVITEK